MVQIEASQNQDDCFINSCFQWLCLLQHAFENAGNDQIPRAFFDHKTGAASSFNEHGAFSVIWWRRRESNPRPEQVSRGHPHASHAFKVLVRRFGRMFTIRRKRRPVESRRRTRTGDPTASLMQSPSLHHQASWRRRRGTRPRERACCSQLFS